MDNSTTVELPTEEDEDNIEMTEVLANGTPKSKRSGVWHFFHENYGEEREGFSFGKVSTMCQSSRYDSMYKHFQHEEALDSSPQKRVNC